MQVNEHRSPQWVRSTIRDFVDHTETLHEVLALTIVGISVIRLQPKLVRAAYAVDEPGHPEDSISAEVKNKIAAAEHRAKLAQREVESDFNIVHSQAVVTLWSALEDSVRTFVAQWLMNLPQVKFEPPWADLKVKIGEYEPLDDEEKAHYLVGLAEQNVAAPLKRGVNRFECLLERLGLGGPVEEKVRDAIFEMQQVRNVIAHRRGIADSRFCRACPSFQLSAGGRVMVSHHMWEKYHRATLEYFIEIMCRTADKFGDLAMRERLRPAAQGDAPSAQGSGKVDVLGSGRPEGSLQLLCSNDPDPRLPDS